MPSGNCHLGCILLKPQRHRGGQGATQFIPESHHSGRDPPLEMQMAEITPGEGFFKNVYQVTAPAGAAFIYDARLWHRACPELNRTDSWRVAILNCVLPSWVVPMLPREQGAEMFVDSYVRLPHLGMLCDGSHVALRP